MEEGQDPQVLKRVREKAIKMNNLKRVYSQKYPDFKWKPMYTADMNEALLDASIDDIEHRNWEEDMVNPFRRLFLTIVDIAEKVSYRLPEMTRGKVPVHLAGLTDDVAKAFDSGELDDEMNSFLVWLGLLIGVGSKTKGITKLGVILMKRASINYHSANFPTAETSAKPQTIPENPPAIPIVIERAFSENKDL